MSTSELLHYLRLGGVTLGLLLAGSLLALGVALERLLALWNVSAESRALAAAVGAHLLRGNLAAARTEAERSQALLADVLVAGFERAARPGGTEGRVLEAAVERERVQLGLRLRRNLWLLGTVGATAPFVGLFGTVAGIMRSFKDLGLDVQAGGAGGSAAVMTGISEALVVTAVGILVAVEAVVLYNYFQSRLSRVSTELRLLCEQFAEELRECAAASPTRAPAEPPAARP
jgi:biopolymer transport protein ExbB